MPDLPFVVQTLELRQQVFPTDLGNDDGKIVLVNIGVVGIDDILDPLREAPEDIEILGIGEAPHLE